MTTARELMTPDCAVVSVDATLAEVARLMRDQDVGAVPVCDGSRLAGLVTDRDIVVRCVAEDADPGAITARDIASERTLTIEADHDAQEALKMMISNGVRRIPVIEEGQLVGIVSQADIALSMPLKDAGELIEAISSAPPNN